MKSTSLISVLSISAILLFASCKTTDNSSIFKDLDTSQSGLLQTNATDVKIEPESELLIIVNSEVPAASAEFNKPYINSATKGVTQLSSAPSLQTYVVDPRGDIDFPKLGTLHVAGMTQMQLKDFLTKRISEYVKNPMVTVQLLGYKVSVLGEVKVPGPINTNAEHYSILDAISNRGGLTEFAVARNILVMRRTSDNNIEYGHINLQDSKITESPYFWLKNNDVVVIPQSDVKIDNSSYNQNNGYKLSVISTIVSATSVIASLVIALTVK